MENASKALIIAGAILISILLISLGILIYNQAQSAVQDGGMDEMQIASFNGKFTQYEGTKRGAQVNSLLQAVIANNSNELNEDRPIAINIEGSSNGISVNNSAKPTQINVSAKANSTYTVKLEYSDKGIINKITISK